MGFGTLVMIAIQGLSTILNNPLLGNQASATARQASELLAILGSLVQKGEEAYEEMKAFAMIIKGMADDGRGPTREERQFLRDQRAVVHAGYQAEKDRILGTQEETQPPQELRTPEEIQADEDAADARQNIADEIASIESVDPENRTEEQIVRLEELTSEE